MTRRPRTGAIVASVVLGLLVATAIIGPFVAPHDPAASGNLVTEKLQPPSGAHLLGTDANARDLFSRMLFGTRISLGITALAVSVIVIVGVAWGAIAGLAAGWLDRWMMRLVDALLATPRLLIVLAVVAFTERLGPGALALLIGLTGWPPMSRLVRAKVRELGAADYVVAARALGTPAPAVFARHILPGVMPVAMVAAMVAVASIIPLEAALDYVGAGIAPPTPSWGVLLRDATDRPLDAWWLLLFPSVAIAATVMCVNVLGERLQRLDRRFLAR